MIAKARGWMGCKSNWLSEIKKKWNVGMAESVGAVIFEAIFVGSG